MKPKYYSCFFLSLFACDQGNIQDTDRKDTSTELINNFCKKVKDINDNNDPSVCVELTTKLVGKYASSFWSLERCQGIFKQLCEQEPTYPSQIVYDVLYALVKNKCLGDAGVRTIIQGIKEENLKVFSLLNNYVCLNRSRVNETDGPARIIAEAFGFIFNNTISIPGINTFTSTPIPTQEKEITIDDLTNIWQCVRFIINNGFDTKFLKKLIKLASSGDFNEAIKAIADAGILFKDSGDDMMKVFEREEVNLNDTGLKALANCIQDNNAKEITKVDSLIYLFPSLNNCKDLAPIFNKCKKSFKIDGDFLCKLAQKCRNNYDDLIESIPLKRFNKDRDTKTAGYLKFLESHSVCNGRLSPLFRKLTNFFQEIYFLTLLGYIDLNSATSLDPLIESLYDSIFNLKYLKKLIRNHKGESDTFNKVLSKISKKKFNTTEEADDVITAFNGSNIQLEYDNLTKVLSMIKAEQQIRIVDDAIDFCCKSIKNLNKENIKVVFNKVKDNRFNLDNLVYLWKQEQDQFDKILPSIPNNKLRIYRGNLVINKIQQAHIKFNKNTIPNVLSMIDGKNKITQRKNNDVFQICCDSEFDAEDINNILMKCDANFKFDLKCLDLYEKVNHDRFNTVLAAIPQENFDKKNKGNDVVNSIKRNSIDFIKGNLSKVLLLCEEETEKITNVEDLYFVFSRSLGDDDGVKVLIALVADNSLEGDDFIDKVIDNKASKAKAQKAFVENFYTKIKDNTITISSANAEKFVWFAYVWYKQDRNLLNLQNKMKKNTKEFSQDMKSFNEALTQTTLKQFCDKDITDDDFKAFKSVLTRALEKL